MNSSSSKTLSALGHFNWFDPQRIIFITFFVTGSLGVVTIKELGMGPMIAIGFSAAVMLAYILYCGTRKFDIRAEILGDNIYYMGFLFTLVSLAYTLYKFTSADNEIDQIIKNFGIALTTTLIGVVGRVYFNQTKDEDDPESVSIDYEIDFDPAQELAESRAEMVREMNACQKVISEQASLLSESIKQTGSAMEALSSQLKSISNATTEVNASLVSERDKYLAMIEIEAERFRSLNASIQSDARDSASALESLSSGLDRLTKARGQ